MSYLGEGATRLGKPVDGSGLGVDVDCICQNYSQYDAEKSHFERLSNRESQ